MTIPDALRAALAGDPRHPAAGEYLLALLAERGIPPETSPADYPPDVFAIFQELNGEQPAPELTDLRWAFARVCGTDDTGQP